MEWRLFLAFLFMVILVGSVLALAYAVTTKIQDAIKTAEKNDNTYTWTSQVVKDASGNQIGWKNFGAWA
jgi:membrane protein required for beta-lactamase induction